MFEATSSTTHLKYCDDSNTKVLSLWPRFPATESTLSLPAKTRQPNHLCVAVVTISSATIAIFVLQ